jgi:cyclophilin family peptidyl-prolyl cis-trans isomerase
MRRLLLLALALCCADTSRAVVLVRVETTLGDFDVELWDDVAPLTVANFLAYARDGDYDGSFIHRSIPGFIVQGGSRRISNNMIAPIPQRPPVVNEFQPCDGGCNVRGTLAMAKLEDLPDSATNSWFINLADNSANLDVQNEGFATFGRVVGDGMSVVDAVAALPRCRQFANCGLRVSYPDLPLRNYAGGGVAVGNLIFAEQITEVPEPGSPALRAGALACVLLLAHLNARRRAAGRRP